MTRHTLTLAALTLLTAAPLVAQMPGMKEDKDKKVEATTLPPGWMSRKDRPTAPDARFELMGTGVHVTSGAAAIYWNEKNKVTVPFTASATFTQVKAPTHPEAYGIFYMGSKLESPEQNYAYLLVRGDGKVMVKHRAGADVHTIMDWTENAAVHKEDANGKATNTLSVVASADSTRLMVNGVQITAIGGSYAKADGIVGLRVNHNLNVHIDAITVREDKMPAAKAKKAVRKATKKG